jgi:transposase-like protein
MEALEREQLADLAEELGEPLEAPTPPLLPQPETQPSQPPAPEPAEMATKKKGERFPVEHKAKVVARWLELTEQAAAKGITGRATGAGSQTAREFKTSEANVSTWVRQHKKQNGAAPAKATKTLASSPASGPVSIAGPLPPMPTVTLSGLEEYVRALVAQEVKAAIRKAFGGE